MFRNSFLLFYAFWGGIEGRRKKKRKRERVQRGEVK